MKAKEQVGADIYLEDSPENVKNLRAKGLFTICFANSTNKDIPEPRGAELGSCVRTRPRRSEEAQGSHITPHRSRRYRALLTP